MDMSIYAFALDKTTVSKRITFDSITLLSRREYAVLRNGNYWMRFVLWI